MTAEQAEALRLMIQKETLAAVLEGELLFGAAGRRESMRDIEHRISRLRHESKALAQALEDV